MAPTVAFLPARGIPVMGHVGLTPQAVNALGGYGARGRSDAEEAQILADARAIDRGRRVRAGGRGRGRTDRARRSRAAVACPVIGIGASADCDGQVLVAEDMLGLFERTPRFVKRYRRRWRTHSPRRSRPMRRDVRARTFPTPDQTYRAKV